MTLLQLLFCILLHVVASKYTSGSDIISFYQGATSSEKETERPVYNDPGTLYTSTPVPLDNGQQIIQMIANRYPDFKKEVGINWTGREILCNCTADYCNNRRTTEIFSGYRLKNVCLGLACYHEKRLHKDADGNLVRSEHMGCWGGEADTHVRHDHHEPIFCASTPFVNTKCCWSSFCQMNIRNLTFPRNDEMEEERLSNINFSKLKTFIIILIGVTTAIGAAGGFIFWMIKSKRPKLFFKTYWRGEEYPMLSLTVERAAPVNPFDEPLLDEFEGEGEEQGQAQSSIYDHPLNHHLAELDESQTPSSSGIEMMQKNNFSGDIVRMNSIGQGRYGTVWATVAYDSKLKVYKCHWKGQTVAMKVILSRYESYYFREISMFQSGTLRHTNILQFFGHDMAVHGGMIEYCILFEYHEHGSLDVYLSRNTVDVTTATRLIYGMASGLAFLHTPMEPTTEKTKHAMAHRDFKSGNVLVKKNLMPCIADLGLSVFNVDGRIGVPNPKVRDHFEFDYKDVPANKEMCGTMRYLSPDLLDGSFDWSVFDCYKAADMYSLGLVMYEICRRIQIEGEEEVPYLESMPYFRQVRENGVHVGDVTFELMRTIVLEQNGRPDPSPWWSNHEVLKEMQRMMNALWMADPSCRLTSANVMLNVQRTARRADINLDQT